MKTSLIIEAVLATPELNDTHVGLAAYLAKTGGYADCRHDVQEWWKKRGGKVDDPELPETV